MVQNCEGCKGVWLSEGTHLPEQSFVYWNQEEFRLQFWLLFFCSRNLDCEGTSKEPDNFQQSLCLNHSRSVQVSTVNGQHYNRPSSYSFQHGRDIGKHPYVTSLPLAWSPSTYMYMNDRRMPQQLLFGEMVQTKPRHGPRKRWCDVVRSDLQAIGVAADEWHEVAQHRLKWHMVLEQLWIRINNQNASKQSYCCWQLSMWQILQKKERLYAAQPILSQSFQIVIWSMGFPKDPAIT